LGQEFDGSPPRSGKDDRKMLGWHRNSPFGLAGTGRVFARPAVLTAGCLCLTACNSGMSRIDLETQKLMA